MGLYYSVDAAGNLFATSSTVAGGNYAAFFDTNDATARINLSTNYVRAYGAGADVDINIIPKGSGSVVLPQATISGGSADNFIIGNSTPAAGTFTNLAATGATFASITSSTYALSDIDASHELNLNWNEDDTSDRNLLFYVYGADRAIHLQSDLYVNQSLLTTDAPEFAGLTLTAYDGILLATTGAITGGATLDDMPDGIDYARIHTDYILNSKITTIADVAENLLTVDLGGSDRVLTLGADATLDQNLRTTDSPTFTGMDLLGDLDLNSNDISGVNNLTVNGALAANGAVFNNVTVVDSATYSLTNTDNILHVTYTGTGTVTITLPTAQCVDKRIFAIKDAGFNATTYNITIDTEGGEKIDGLDEAIVATDGDALVIYAYGGNWYIY